MPIPNSKPGVGVRKPESSSSPNQPPLSIQKTPTFSDGYRDRHRKTQLVTGGETPATRTRTIVTSKPEQRKPIPPINQQKASLRTTNPRFHQPRLTYSSKLGKQTPIPKTSLPQDKPQDNQSILESRLLIAPNANSDSLINNNDAPKSLDRNAETPILSGAEVNDGHLTRNLPSNNAGSGFTITSGSIAESGETNPNDTNSQISSVTSIKTVVTKEPENEQVLAKQDLIHTVNTVQDSNRNLGQRLTDKTSRAGRIADPLFTLHSSNHDELKPQNANEGRRHVCSTTIIRDLEMSAQLPSVPRSTWVVSPTSTVTSFMDNDVGNAYSDSVIDEEEEIYEDVVENIVEADASSQPIAESHDTDSPLPQEEHESIPKGSNSEEGILEQTPPELQPTVALKEELPAAESNALDHPFLTDGTKDHPLTDHTEDHPPNASIINPSPSTEPKLQNSPPGRKRRTNFFSNLLQQNTTKPVQSNKNAGRPGTIVKNMLARVHPTSRSAPQRFHAEKPESGQDFKRLAQPVITTQDYKRALLRNTAAEKLASAKQSTETKVANVPKPTDYQDPPRNDITFSKIVLFYNNGTAIAGNIRIKNITSELVHFRVSPNERNAYEFIIEPKEGKLESNKSVIIRLLGDSSIITDTLLKEVTFKIETVRMSVGAISYSASRRIWMNVQPSNVQTVWTAYSVLFDAKKSFFKHYVKPENASKGREDEDKRAQPGPSVDLKEVILDIELAQAEETKLRRYRTLQLVVAAMLVSIGCVLSCPGCLNRIAAFCRFSKP